jgi:hypothetical protein
LVRFAGKSRHRLVKSLQTKLQTNAAAQGGAGQHRPGSSEQNGELDRTLRYDRVFLAPASAVGQKASNWRACTSK